MSHPRNPTWPKPLQVRLWPACRGRRAWHAKKEQTGTWETQLTPAALITRAKRVGRLNDKESRPKGNWESDRFIVAQGKPVNGSDLSEGSDSSARLAQATSAVRLTEQRWQTFLPALRLRVGLKSPVRENRPPGSVRGAPGNRCPYLDKC